MAAKSAEGGIRLKARQSATKLEEAQQRMSDRWKHTAKFMLIVAMNACGAALLILPVLCTSDAVAKVPDYVSSDGWILRYKGEVSQEQADYFAQISMGHAVLGKLYLQIHNEPGLYVAFAIQGKKDLVLLWGPKSRVVAIDKEGKRDTSEACFFSADKAQTRIFDTRKETVSVDRRLMPSSRGGISVTVKFPSGSLSPERIAELKVENVTVWKESR